MAKNIMITGGAGFIGSHVIKLFVAKYPDYNIVNVDALTYSGNLSNLESIAHHTNYFFEKVNILDENKIADIFKKYQINAIIHLAAESHVDRSILNPLEFVKTNVLGTYCLLNMAKQYWGTDLKDKLFYHISTDEVYGSLENNEEMFTEYSTYSPRSPYSASKASSDHFVFAYYHTFNLPVLMSNCSNNYGSFHFPEKLIPLVISNILNNKKIPVYGKGENVRDWLWVEDHARAIDIIFHKGKVGEKYNVGGFNEWKNIDLVNLICDILDQKLNRPNGNAKKLIEFVTDRKGHDLRYAIDANKIKNELGWKPSVTFEQGIEKTIDWYLNNREWAEKIISGDYLKYYEQQYLNKQ